jgi:hypothetical protein
VIIEVIVKYGADVSTGKAGKRELTRDRIDTFSR